MEFREVTITFISNNQIAGYTFGVAVISASLLLFTWLSLSIWRVSSPWKRRDRVLQAAQISAFGVAGGAYMCYINYFEFNLGSDGVQLSYAAIIVPALLECIFEALMYLAYRMKKPSK